MSTEVSTRAQQNLENVHADVLGPIIPVAVDGHKYAIGFIDSYTRMVKVHIMESREEVLQKTKRYFAEVGALKTLVTDGAKEFVLRDMRALCYINRVRFEQSTPYTPQENGKIEQARGTLMGKTRCLLATAGLSKEFWTYALHHATFIKNRTIQSSIGCTLYEKIFGRKPNIKDLKKFSCTCYVHIESQFRKVDGRAKECLFLGYD